MGQRLDLHQILLAMTSNVYFQPPTNVRLQYPCIVYHRDFADTKFADDEPYNHTKRYQIMFGNGGGTPVTGPFISDGNWHFVVITQENGPSDGVKRKFYVDGRLVASSTILNSVVLGGANKFVVGSSLASASNFIGEIDTVFVTDYVLGMFDITKLYTKSLVDHLPSPKNAGDHVQAMDDDHILVAFDTLDIADKVSLKVMA